MRIIIDLQGAQTESRYRGIGRYTLALTQALLSANRNHEVIVLLNGLLLDEHDPLLSLLEQWLLPSYIKIWYAPGPVSADDPQSQLRLQQAELIREACIEDLHPDVVLIPSFFEGFIDDAVISIKRWDQHTPIAVCMLDLIPLLNSSEYLDPNPAYKAFYLSRIEQLRQADSYLAISKSSQAEAEQHLATQQQPVINASIAVDAIFVDQQLSTSEKQSTRQQLGLGKPFILYTGGADARKNLPNLIRAYALLTAALGDSYSLVLAGRIPAQIVCELQDLATQLQVPSEQLIFTGYVSDKELVSLYNTCELFIFPSWHEGFGLPALEAIRCGAPTLVANRSSLPEVVGKSDALFDPFEPSDIASKMQKVLCNPDFQAQLCVLQKQHSKLFNWDKSAKLTWQTLEELASTAHHQPRTSSANIKQALLNTLLTDSIDAEHEQQLRTCLKKTFATPKQSTLWVDISELQQQDARTGIQRVTRSLLQQLLHSPPRGFKTIPVYADTSAQGYKIAARFLPQAFNSDLLNNPIDYHCGDIFLGLDLQHHTSLFQAPILQQMHSQGVHVHFVVYDLLPILLPDTFPPGVAQLHQQWLRHISNFDRVLCISKTVAQELQHWLIEQQITPNATPGWFHLGADIKSSQPSKGLPDNYLKRLQQWGKRPSLINVGTLEPRKGQAQALDALELLWAKGYAVNLILVGKQGWDTEALVQRIQSHPQLNQQLFWLENASDEFLELIYPVCSALLATSLGEGFGLPLLEAQNYGLAVIARDLPVFREVLNNHGLYFSGGQGGQLLSVIEQHLNAPTKKIAVLKNTQPLTWQDSAQQLLTNLIIRNITMPTTNLNVCAALDPISQISLRAKKNLGQLGLLLEQQPSSDPLAQQLLTQALLDFDYSLKHNNALEQQLQQLSKTQIQQELQLEQLHQHNQQLQDSAQALQHETHTLQQQLRSLAPQAELAEVWQQQLQVTLQSRSWKLTTPVRFISQQTKIRSQQARQLSRYFAAQLILNVEKHPRFKQRLLQSLTKFPRLYQHLWRFKQHRILNQDTVAPLPPEQEEQSQGVLSPSSTSIYTRLKQEQAEAQNAPHH